MKIYSRVYASVDLDAIIYNMEQMHQHINPNTKMIAVVKTDGYGHGALPIARVLQEKPYIWGFAVASVEEGTALKKNGISLPVLVLGSVFPEQIEAAIEHEIRLTVYCEEVAQLIEREAIRCQKKAYVHLKIDTGMARLGFCPEKEELETAIRVGKLPNLVLEGVYTHFAKADETDKTYTKMQQEGFQHAVKTLRAAGLTFPYEHCSNSAGIIDIADANMDLVRAGIAMYGLYPSKEVDKQSVRLKPALELKSKVASVKQIKAGTCVSYGGTFKAPCDMTVAVIPVGYGDGYPRSLSNKGSVLIHGQKAPILGRICMDQFMVDVSAIKQTAFGDEVTLVGRDGDAFLSVEELSDISERFNYEFICDLGKRIPRVYRKNNQMVEQVDYFG